MAAASVAVTAEVDVSGPAIANGSELRNAMTAAAMAADRAGRGNLDKAVSGVSACRLARCGLRIRRDHVETTAPEPHTGLEGEGFWSPRGARSAVGMSNR